MLFLLSALLLAASPGTHGDSPAAPRYRVVHLTGLTPGTFGASALNDAGEVAGVVFGERDTLYVWKDGVLKTRGLSGKASVAGVNEDGVVVGTVTSPEACTTFAWFSGTDELLLLPTPVPAFPSDVNEDLLIVGGDCAGLQGYAHDGTTGGFQTIAFGAVPAQSVGTLGASGVNASGTVVGSEVVFDPGLGAYIETPYRWTSAGGIVALPTLPNGFGGRGVAVDEGGTIAGYVIDDVSGKQTAMWTDGGTALVEIGSPRNFFVSEPTAINARGQIAVVAPNDFFGYTRAFVWERGAFVDLSAFTPPGLFALRPVDLNDRGDVLVQLGDALGLQILDNVILRPVRAPRARRVSEPLRPAVR